MPIPALLATAGVHHHLIREGLRTSVGLVVETGDAREVHHFCALAGYGAEAINPYLAFETLSAMKRGFPEEVDAEEIVHRYIKAIDKGILKVMAKMGISTYQSYCGAQIFDAVGLSTAFVEALFHRHRDHHRGRRPRRDRRGDARAGIATPSAIRRCSRTSLSVGGDYAFRFRGEVPCLAARHGGGAPACRPRQCARTSYREFARLVNETEDKYLTIRSLFRIKTAEEDGRTPVPLEEVESAAEHRQAASRPAPCPTARSAARRTRRSPSP